MSSSYGRSSKETHKQAGYPDGGSRMPDEGSGRLENVYPELALPLARVGRVFSAIGEYFDTAARNAVKDEVFTSRNASELKEILG
jgi:hypothetical protein